MEQFHGTTILAAWLRDRGEREGQVIALDAERPLEEQLREWEAALAELLRIAPAASALGSD